MPELLVIPAFDSPMKDGNKLRGFLHNEMHLNQSNVMIGARSYEIMKVRLIEITLFTVNGKMSLSCQGDTIRDQSKVKAFLSSCGISSRPLFLKKFFSKPVLVGTKAIINVWYHQFEENTYF